MTESRFAASLRSGSVAPSGAGPSGTRRSLVENARVLLDLGFDRVVLPPRVSSSDWDELGVFLRPGAVLAAHASPHGPARGRQRRPRLGSHDADERREALKLGEEALRFLDKHDIPVLIVAPEELDKPSVEQVRAALESRSPEIARQRLLEARRESVAVASRRDAFLGTLYRLADRAARYDRRIAIVPGGLPHELPDFVEVESFRSELAGAPVVTLLDMVRFERAAVFGSERRDGGPLREDGPPVWAVRVHDGDLDRDGLALGDGFVDLDHWRVPRESVSAPERWIVDLGVNATEAEILAARAGVDELPAPAPEAPEFPLS